LLVVRRQRGDQTREKSAKDRNGYREHDDHSVDVNGIGTGNVMPGVNQPAKRDLREHQATRSSCDGKDEAFNYLLANEAAAASAEGGADCGLSASRCGACDEKIRNIEAGDQQQASGGGEHGVEAGFEMKDFSIEDRPNVGRIVNWPVWILLPYLPLDRTELCCRLCNGDSGFEPANRIEVVSGKQSHDDRGSLVIDRRPQLDLAVRVIEPLGKNSQNHVRLCVKQDGFTDELRVSSVAPLPQSPGQDYGRIRLATIIAREEESSTCRFDTKERKDVPRSHLPVHQLRQLAART
jgi:hypothetical protein